MGSGELERGLSNQGWRSLFPAAEIKVLDVSNSDHLPLYLQVNKQLYVPEGNQFGFENTWIREKDCLQLIKDSWSRDGITEWGWGW